MSDEILKNEMPIQKCIAGMELDELSDSELLAIILQSGIKKMNVMEISTHILKEYSGFRGLYKTSLNELSKKKGIGKIKAIRILAALEIGRRILKKPENKINLKSPYYVWELLQYEIIGKRVEHFYVLILDNKNNCLKKSLISKGTVSETIAHPREIFLSGVKEGASSIIIAHNHPSGDVTPSRDDIVTTKRIYEAGRILGIPLVDHIIVTANNYFSFKEEGYFETFTK